MHFAPGYSIHFTVPALRMCNDNKDRFDAVRSNKMSVLSPLQKKIKHVADFFPLVTLYFK